MTINSNMVALMLCGAIIAIAPLAYAQDDDSNQETESLNLISRTEGENKIEFSFGNPDSPALSLAGLKASEATKVDELQDITISLPQFSNGDTALAVDLSPAAIFMRDGEETIDDYDDLTYFGRLLRRTKASMLARNGVQNSSDPSKSVKSLFAAGVSLSIFDWSDPLFVRVDKTGKCEAFIEEATDWINNTPVTLSDIEGLVGPEAEWYIQILSGNFASDHFILGVEAIDEARLRLANAGVDISDIQSAGITDRDLQGGGDLIAKALPILNEADALLRQSTNAHFENNPANGDLIEAANICYDAVEDARLYKPNFDIGGAALWRGKEDGFGDFKSGGQAIWLSYRHPIKLTNNESNHYFVVGGSGRFGLSEFASTGDMTTAEAKADTEQFWVGAELFTDKWRMAGQVGYVDVDFDDPSMAMFSRSGDKWQVSADYEISNNIWLGLSYGEAQGTIEALEGERLTVDLKFSTPKALDLFSLNPN